MCLQGKRLASSPAFISSWQIGQPKHDISHYSIKTCPNFLNGMRNRKYKNYH